LVLAEYFWHQNDLLRKTCRGFVSTQVQGFPAASGIKLVKEGFDFEMNPVAAGGLLFVDASTISRNMKSAKRPTLNPARGGKPDSLRYQLLFFTKTMTLQAHYNKVPRVQQKGQNCF